MRQAEKLLRYAVFSGDYLNIEAVFADETENFLRPSAPKAGEPVTFCIRTARNNVDRVFLCAGGERLEMAKCPRKADLFDLYAVTRSADGCRLNYYFCLEKNGRAYFYNKRGLFPSADPAYHFAVIPGFKTPDWAKGCVMYQIYVDRFYDGDPANNVVPNEYAYLGNAARTVLSWDQPVENLDVCNFYGGDLKGVMDKMDYLKQLGVEAVYFNPVFVSPSNHKYDIQDYDYIDPHFGVIAEDGGEPLYFEKFHNKFATKYIKRTTDKKNLEAGNELFCKLVEAAHANGIKVIIDGVFNHCGAFNRWMDKQNFYSGKGHPNGAYLDESSPYHDYFRWYDKNWPNNDAYDSWWGIDNHPKLNYEASPELYQYMMDIGRKWVSPPFNADGWRVDVAADVGYSPAFNHQFWRDFRANVKAANPDAIILAEHYGDPSPWLLGDQWDTIMNYDAFMEPITWFLTGMEKHSEEFRPGMLNNAMAFEEAMRGNMARMTNESLSVAMNELSNHDHSRFLTRTNRTAGRLHTAGAKAAGVGVNMAVMLEAVTFQMTWPGAPTVYYGDEAGVSGWTDPDNRRTYPWGHEDRVLIAFHKAAIALRKRYGALRTGSVQFLHSEHGVVTFGRFDEANRLAVLLNNNESPRTLALPVWKTGMNPNGRVRRLLMTSEEGYTAAVQEFAVKDGFLTVTMPPASSMVFVEV